MALKGQAKAEYQRHYMRRYRAEGRDLRDSGLVRPLVRPTPISGKTQVVRPGEATHPFRPEVEIKVPELDADGNPIPEY